MNIDINSELIKEKKNMYKGKLNIVNNGSINITSYSIECILDNGSTIDEIRNFIISNINANTIKLESTKVLKANDSMTVKFEGKGKMPINFKYISTPTPIPTPIPIPDNNEDKPSNIILKLVSIAENSSTDWESQINYIENINDGRGYTISIVGFCTGTGDFIQVLEEIQKIDSNHPLVKFIPLVQKVDGTSSVKGLEGLPSVMKSIGINDPVFNKAMWIIIKKLYWGPALEYCRKHNLVSNLSKYITYDTYLNFGQWDYNKKYNLDNIPNSEEANFLKTFLDLKQKTIEADNSLGDKKNNRVDMQKKLLFEKNFNLNLPITVSCYGDTFNIK